MDDFGNFWTVSDECRQSDNQQQINYGSAIASGVSSEQSKTVAAFVSPGRA
jgi:hypothetical protein